MRYEITKDDTRRKQEAEQKKLKKRKERVAKEKKTCTKRQGKKDAKDIGLIKAVRRYIYFSEPM